MAGISFRKINRPLDYIGGFRDFDLEIDDGEFVALVGRNGCGRAELIRMAEGYGGAYEGEVYIGGRRVTRRTRGDASLVNDMPLAGTPRREIMSMLSKSYVGKDQAARRLKEASEAVGAGDLMDIRWSRLDPRSRLKAGFARALATGAKVLLMTDPLEGVDRRTAAKMRADIMEFYADTHMTVLMATASGENAMALATRIVALDDGAIRQTDTPQNIYDYPADRFVAEYFGREEINIIPVTLAPAGEEVYAHFGDNNVLVPQGKISRLIDPGYVGRSVLMGVRPENLHYEQSFISLAPESSVEVLVRHVELLGSETFLHTRMDGVEGDVIARVDPRCIASPGISMALAFDTNRVHFFDPDTGRSILNRL